jgi:hypothetical protein
MRVLGQASFFSLLIGVTESKHCVLDKGNNR